MINCSIYTLSFLPFVRKTFSYAKKHVIVAFIVKFGTIWKCVCITKIISKSRNIYFMSICWSHEDNSFKFIATTKSIARNIWHIRAYFYFFQISTAIEHTIRNRRSINLCRFQAITIHKSKATYRNTVRKSWNIFKSVTTTESITSNTFHTI